MKTRAGTAALLVLAAMGCGLDAQNLPDLVYGVDEEGVWRDGSKPVVPAAPREVRLLMTNNLDDTVSVVSLDKLLAGGDGAEIDRFVVGLFPIEREGPHHLATSSDGRFGYVGISNFVPLAGSGPHGSHGTGTDDGRLLLVDLDTQRTLKNVRIDPNPGDVRLTPDGKRLLATHFDQAKILEAAQRDVFSGPELDARLAIVDVATFEREVLLPLCPAPHGIAITADSKFAVASCRSDEAAVVDLENLTVRRVVLLDEPGTAAAPVCDPYAVTLDRDGVTAWVSCYAAGSLIGVDIASATRAETIVQGAGRAIFGDTAEDGTLAIATQDTDGVVFAKDGVVVDFLALPAAVCELPHTANYIDDDTTLIVVCEGNKADPGAVIAIDVASLTVLGRTLVGRFPDDLAIQVKP